MNKLSKLAHQYFLGLPVEETCGWPGTEWVGEGKDAHVLPCGAPTVGNGLFCDPNHRRCYIASICKNHKQPVQTWQDDIEPWGSDD